MTKALAPLVAACLAGLPALAGEAVVVGAEAHDSGAGWRVDVTLRHADTGWDHYADGWSVETADGTELGYRKLLHPHVNEQPFTRSLGGVAVPEGVDVLYIRAHDSVHGWTSQRFELRLSGR